MSYLFITISVTLFLTVNFSIDVTSLLIVIFIFSNCWFEFKSLIFVLNLIRVSSLVNILITFDTEI